MGRNLALALVVSLVWHAPTAADPSDTTPPKRSQRTVSGFRMEGAPAVDVVFGDSETYRRHIDTFFVLSEKMAAKRNSFTRFAQASLATLAKHPRKRGRSCPTIELAPYYYRAHTDAEDYRVLGIALEDTYGAVTALDRYGETAGLTPDYKLRVAKVRGMYRRALTDYRELQIALLDQLDPEVAHRGCKKSELFTRGARTAALPLADPAANTPRARSRRSRKPPVPVVRAQSATFVIDNRKCNRDHEVFVGGIRLGTAPAAKKAAFQVKTGEHELCLLAAGGAAKCGQPGTLRKAYIHDGWSLALHCGAVGTSRKGSSGKGTPPRKKSASKP